MPAYPHRGSSWRSAKRCSSATEARCARRCRSCTRSASASRSTTSASDTGSLSSLRSFPFKKVKIDRALVREMPGSADNAAIVKAVAMLAETLGMGTVAEGVETLDELNTVKRAGCNKAQGFFIGRPVPVAELAAVLSECVLKHSRAA